MEDGDAHETQTETVELFRPIDLRVKRRTLSERATRPECAQPTDEQMMQWVDGRESRRAEENGSERELRGHRPTGHSGEESGLAGHDEEHHDGQDDARSMTRPDSRHERCDREDDPDDVDHRAGSNGRSAEIVPPALRQDAENAAHDVLRDGERMMPFEILIALFAQAIAEAFVADEALDALGEGRRITGDERLLAVFER